MDDSLLAFHYADRAKAFHPRNIPLIRILPTVKHCRELMLEILKGCEKENNTRKNICSR